MRYKTSAELIFERNSRSAAGSPERTEVVPYLLARVEDIGTFSRAYYNEGDRNMAESVNLRIRTDHLDYLDADHQLIGLIYKDKRYAIKTILNDKETRRYRILDCEALRD